MQIIGVPDIRPFFEALGKTFWVKFTKVLQQEPFCKITSTMNHFQSEVLRISNLCYANHSHVETAIGLRRFIDNHFAEKLTLNILSNEKYVSKFHLHRIFKRIYGQTPRQYLTQKRLSESKKYLRQGMSVSDTCYQVGYDAPTSFSTLFRKNIGVSPIEYKKSNFDNVNKRQASDL